MNSFMFVSAQNGAWHRVGAISLLLPHSLVSVVIIMVQTTGKAKEASASHSSGRGDTNPTCVCSGERAQEIPTKRRCDLANNPIQRQEIRTLTHLCWVITSKSLTLSVPQFPHMGTDFTSKLLPTLP